MYFNIKVTGAELDVVRLALGRMVEAKPIVDRKAKAATPKPFPNGRPPKLNDKARAETTSRWAHACENPDQWRAQLARTAADNTGRAGDIDAVNKAWGIIERDDVTA